jgi:hypothetical protein
MVFFRIISQLNAASTQRLEGGYEVKLRNNEREKE